MLCLPKPFIHSITCSIAYYYYADACMSICEAEEHVLHAVSRVVLLNTIYA